MLNVLITKMIDFKSLDDSSHQSLRVSVCQRNLVGIFFDYR